jgi:hypothetical protein
MAASSMKMLFFVAAIASGAREARAPAADAAVRAAARAGRTGELPMEKALPSPARLNATTATAARLDAELTILAQGTYVT